MTLALLAAVAALAPQLQPAIQSTIAGMTLEQKVAQLQSDAPALPSGGLAAVDYWNEGLHGLARNGIATVFPQAIGLAATWDQPLLRAVGDTISTEARARYNALPRGGARLRYQGLTIWSPNINIFRDPRWGRGQETYGEDPYLTGQLAAGFIQGLQGPDRNHPKVIATPKHLAVHSGPEAGRDGFDVDVSPRDLEETYTPAFRTAIRDGGALSVMCAYNALHGVPVCASPALMTDTIRTRWGFDGFTVSDCDAVGNIAHYHFYRPDDAAGSAAAIEAGTDLNCGRSYHALADAVHRGIVHETVLDQAVSRVFTARALLGEGFGQKSPWDHIPASAVDTPDHRALARKAAQEAIVLLKNRNGRLPLQKGARIAVIGPNADTLEVLEANYHGTAADPVTPLQGLRSAFGADHIAYAQGSTVADHVPLPVPETALSADGKPGLNAEYFGTADVTGAPRLRRQDRHVDFDWDRAAPAPGLPARGFSVRWTGTLTPPAPGDYQLRVDIPRCFDCTGHDPIKLWVDDRLVIDDDGDDTHVSATLTFLHAGAHAGAHALRIEYRHISEDGGIGLRWVAPADVQRQEAVRVAKEADAVVAFIGLSPSVEGEALRVEVPGFAGGDRTAIELPEPQRRLLEDVSATGKPLILVLMSGGAVAPPWSDEQADAVLAAWYPGEAGGTAIADILSGAANPSGRLPVTFYRATRDLPAFADYNMRERSYRFFSGSPLYPFGHGLSFTQFGYGVPMLSATSVRAGDTVTVTAQIRNTGHRAGAEVAQAYLTPPTMPGAGFNDPVLQRALVGFQRLTLKPGETAMARFTLDARALSTVDSHGERRVRPGRYRVWIGGGQPGDAVGSQADFFITGERDVAR